MELFGLSKEIYNSVDTEYTGSYATGNQRRMTQYSPSSFRCICSATLSGGDAHAPVPSDDGMCLSAWCNRAIHFLCHEDRLSSVAVRRHSLFSSAPQFRSISRHLRDNFVLLCQMIVYV